MIPRILSDDTDTSFRSSAAASVCSNKSLVGDGGAHSDSHKIPLAEQVLQSVPDDEEEEDGMWTRRYDFDGVKLKVEEAFGEGLGGTVWAGSVLLARFLRTSNILHQHQKHLTKDLSRTRPIRLVELGAGCSGLPGMVAASTGHVDEVFLTDRGECMERLAENVAANAGAYSPSVTVKVEDLDWGSAEDHARMGKVDILIAADVVFELADPESARSREVTAALVGVLRALASEETLVLFAHMVCPISSEVVFWEEVQRWFTIEKLAGPMRGEEAAPAAAPGCDQAPQQAADDTHPAAPKRDGHAAKADIGRDSEQDMGVFRLRVKRASGGQGGS